MRELYLETFSNVSECGVCYVPLETVIALFVCEFFNNLPLFIHFALNSAVKGRAQFRIELGGIPFEVLKTDNIELPGNLFKLPYMVLDERRSCVAGLCAVLRHLVKLVDQYHPLLGFKQGCLYACAETSVWTKFCEVDVIKSVNDLFLITDRCHEVVIPDDIARFEGHMKKPVKTHNIQKQKQILAQKNGFVGQSRLSDGKLKLLKDLEHTYSEGHQMTLADLILLPCFHLVLQMIGSPKLFQQFPLTYTWYHNLMKNETVSKSIRIISEIERKFENGSSINYSVPEISNDSFYKSEKGSSRSKKHIYTKQRLVRASFESVGDLINDLKWEKFAFGHEVEFDWSSVPMDLQLESSDFPKKRLQRKAEQLLNFTKAVLKIAKEGDRVVEFCSGSGHLGLVLAYALPNCTIVLLENKEESLKRARRKAINVNLNNLVFCQSNIDYFTGDFDIGVSLHACGVATDLVIEKCLKRGASFICCPCCYGSIHPNHLVEYPRSQRYRNSVTLTDYLILAHSSDQTHDEKNVKTNQGKKCMAIIDIDRCLRAKEKGYVVFISTLEPSSCTPKNNFLVGVAPQNLE